MRIIAFVLALGLMACAGGNKVIVRDVAGSGEVTLNECKNFADQELKVCELENLLAVERYKRKTAEDAMLGGGSQRHGSTPAMAAPMIIGGRILPMPVMGQPTTVPQIQGSGIQLERIELGGWPESDHRLMACIRRNGMRKDVNGGRPIFVDPDGRGTAEPLPWSCATPGSTVWIPGVGASETVQVVFVAPTGQSVGGSEMYAAAVIRDFEPGSTIGHYTVRRGSEGTPIKIFGR